nr:unnamed protein product [Digitaria exilis]
MDAADASPLEVSPRAGSWRRSRPWSRSSSIGRSGSISSSSNGGSGSLEYTSLRDVLEEESSAIAGGEQQHQQQQGFPWSSGWGEYSCHDIHDFDASNIGIRNQLLKHAASAYLQSAVVVVNADGRDGGEGGYCCLLARLWRRCGGGGGGGGGGGRRGRGGRGRVLMRACSWQGCVDDPAEFVARAARRLAAFVAGRVNAVWAW